MHVGDDGVLFAIWPIRISPLYFSVVEEERADSASFADQLKQMREEMRQDCEANKQAREETKRIIRRLEMKSSTAGVRDRVFDECTELSFEEWKRRLGVHDDGDAAERVLAKLSPKRSVKSHATAG
jgi:hypothetical protein